MTQLTVDQGTTDTIDMIQEAIKVCRQGMSERVALWLEAKDAYETVAPIVNSNEVSIEVNHVNPLIERLLPREIQAVHPQRPYLPLRANLTENQWAARIYERAIDNSMDRGGYFPSYVDGERGKLNYGCGFVRPFWDAWYENQQIRQPQFGPDGQIQGLSNQVQRMMRDGLRFEYIPCWAALAPPNGDTLLSKEFFIVNRVVNLAEIERGIETKRYAIDPAVGIAKLKSGMTSEGVEWQKQFEKDVDVAYQGSDTQRVGVLTEFYSDKRWACLWNYEIDLSFKMDQSPRLYNVDLRTKPVAQLRRNVGVGASRFWGEPWWATIRDKSMLDSLWMTLYAHQLLQSGNRIKFIREGLIDKEKLTAGLPYGAVVEIPESVRDVREVIDEWESAPPGSGMMEMHGFTDDQITRMSSQTEITRGQQPAGTPTAKGMSILQSEQQTNLGFGARYDENTYLVEMAALVTSLFGSNITIPQMAELVGWEDTQAVNMTPDPNSIPGGYHMQFDGAERVVQRQLRFERIKEAWSDLSQLPRIASSDEAQNVFIEEYLKMAGMDDRKIEQVMTAPSPPPPPPEPPPPAPASVPQGPKVSVSFKGELLPVPEQMALLQASMGDMQGQPPPAAPPRPGVPEAPLQQAPTMTPPDEMAAPASNEQAAVEGGGQ
jgi:hypothetical protein